LRLCGERVSEGIARMIVTNTSKYPTKEVRRLVRFALKRIPQNHRLEVHVKNSKRALVGNFYPSVPYCSNAQWDRSFLIVARIGTEDKFPREHVYSGNSHVRCKKYACTLNDWREALVNLVAHEGEHLRQWLKKGRFREDHAERRALKTLMKYRSMN